MCVEDSRFANIRLLQGFFVSTERRAVPTLTRVIFVAVKGQVVAVLVGQVQPKLFRVFYFLKKLRLLIGSSKKLYLQGDSVIM